MISSFFVVFFQTSDGSPETLSARPHGDGAGGDDPGPAVPCPVAVWTADKVSSVWMNQFSPYNCTGVFGCLCFPPLFKRHMCYNISETVRVSMCLNLIVLRNFHSLCGFLCNPHWIYNSVNFMQQAALRSTPTLSQTTGAHLVGMCVRHAFPHQRTIRQPPFPMCWYWTTPSPAGRCAGWRRRHTWHRW